jgi:hypothetical protein
MRANMRTYSITGHYALTFDAVEGKNSKYILNNVLDFVKVKRVLTNCNYYLKYY